jgi:hypothetical protein
MDADQMGDVLNCLSKQDSESFAGQQGGRKAKGRLDPFFNVFQLLGRQTGRPTASH